MHSRADFRPFHFTADDGIVLYGRAYGERNAGSRPVVCLAGLSRNSRDFHQLATLFATQGRQVVTLDYRGRGLSGWDPNAANYNLLREAQDVLQALAPLGITEADFIGTSRGGLILHFLPTMVPGLVRSVVLNDVGPVIEIDGLRRIRDYLSARPEPRDFAQAARALKASHSGEFPILTDEQWLEMADAVFREVGGKIVPDYDPRLIEPLKTLDLSQPPPDLWEQFATLKPLPLLVVRGENSSLLSQSTVEHMMNTHGNARALLARGQGHAPLLHVPGIASEIADFLRND
jgi:pimeloyl-ACP methyl ester carboxylesterase